MEILFIRQLIVSALIGVYDSEKVAPQPISLDLEIAIDAAAAAATDDIATTIDYAAIYHYLLEYIPSTRFQLLETLAVNISDNLIQKYSLPWLRLTITKKPSDMPFVSGAGVIIERKRSDVERNKMAAS